MYGKSMINEVMQESVDEIIRMHFEESGDKPAQQPDVQMLNKDWKEEYGGSLELWDKKMKGCEKKISIQFNKIFLFSTNDESFHGYPDPINCPKDKSRKSIAMYYYSNGRPDKDNLLKLPNTTIWKNRQNINEVDNNYSLKDYLRKFKLLRKLKNYFF